MVGALMQLVRAFYRGRQRQPMLQLGHKRTWRQVPMSAVIPIADRRERNWIIRFVRKADIVPCSLQLGTNGFLVAMLVDAQLSVDIRFLEAAIGDPCVRALNGAVDQRIGL